MNRRYFYLLAIILAGIFLRIYDFFRSPPPSLDLPNQIASTIISVLLIPLIYKLAKDAIGDAQAGLFAALLASIVPLYSWKTVGQFIHALGVGFFLFSIFIFLQLKRLDWRVAAIVPAIFAFVHAYSLFLIPIFGFYILLTKLEQHELSKNEIYFMMSSSLIILAINVFFQLSPITLYFIKNYIENYYYIITIGHFSLIETFSIVGLIPVYLGIVGAYFGLLLKKKSVLLCMSAIFISLVSMLLGFVPIILGLPYFTFPLCILGGFFLLELKKQIHISRFKNFEHELTLLIFVLTFLLGLLHWLT